MITKKVIFEKNMTLNKTIKCMLKTSFIDGDEKKLGPK